MATLPPELLRHITSEVTFDLVYHPEYRASRYDMGTLRSLRLASQTFSIIASEHLFAEVVLFFTKSSHEKMTAIAQHPIYSKYVRSLKISPKAIFGPLLDRDAFGRWLRAERSLIRGNGWFLQYVDPAKRPHISPTVADYHYGQYSSLYKEQEMLYASAGSLLLNAVSRFPRLENVKSGICTRLTPYSVPSSLDISFRGHWQDVVGLYQFDLDHSIMILTALSQGQTMAGSRLDIGEMFNLINALIMDLPESENSAKIENLVTGVKTLPIRINTFDSDGFQNLLDRGRCARFLGLMTNLESMSLSISHATNSPFTCLEVPETFGDTTWPHLRRLELGRFFATTSELSNLFRRHKSTLEILALSDILVDSESWYQVFADLRGSVLRDISVFHLGRGDYHPVFFHDACDPYFIPMPETHLLLTFLFKGGPWVKKMDELLEFGDLEREESEEAEVQEESEEDEGD